MARLMSEARGGYYPVPPPALDCVLDRLTPPATGECLVFDPCCGEGAALAQVAKRLNAVPYGIELSEDRAEEVAAIFPAEQVLVPADFLLSRISPGTFSFIWANPPYQYSVGGTGRVEAHFIAACVPTLVEGGILALACPESVANDYDMMRFFGTFFAEDTLTCFPYPEGHRQYNEVVVMGEKRKEANPYPKCWNLWEEIWQRPTRYQMPPGRRPAVYVKKEPTDAEAAQALATSPLRHLFHIERELPPARPPMSPGDGHRAMLLASGFLSGLVQPVGEPPHVVRGLARKETYLAHVDTSEDSKGNVTTRSTYSEKIRLIIRTLDHQGLLTTLQE